MKTRGPAPARSSYTLRGAITLLSVLSLLPGLTRTASAQALVSVTKTDGITYASGGDPVTYTIVVSAAAVDPAVAVADTFPTELTGCGWTSVATGGATGNSASSGGALADTLNMPGGSSVTYTVACTVVAGATGTLVNTVTVTPSQGAPVSATDNDTDLGTAAVPPGFSKSFAPDPIGAGGTSTLTFTIDNAMSPFAIAGLDFTDTLPAGVTVATPATASTTCTLGTLTAVAGAGTISYGGGGLSALAVCTVQVDVTSTTPGTHVNTTGDLTSSGGNSGTASDSLTVLTSPTFTKAFSPDSIVAVSTTTLSFTLDNTGSGVAATAVDFTDTLPAGVIVATPSNAATTCTGGTLTAAAGAGTISYTGSTIPASSSCVVTVDVTSSTIGAHVNTTGDLTSSSGNSGTAADTLTVVTNCITESTATGTGSEMLCLEGGGPACLFTSSSSSTAESLGTPPAGVAFPHGLVSFTASGCTDGATVQFTATYPGAGDDVLQVRPRAGEPNASLLRVPGRHRR